MEFTIELLDNNIVVLHLSGKLIGHHQIQPIIDPLVEHIEEGRKHFVVELSKVRLISSVGLTILLTILTKSRNAGGEAILTDISSQLSKLLIITKLNAIFTVAPTVGEAVKVLQKMQVTERILSGEEEE